MRFDDLLGFVTERMRMSHPYRPKGNDAERTRRGGVR